MQETLTLADGTLVHVADFEFGFTLDSKAVANEQEDGSVLIEGYASDFGLDRQEEAFLPGAFEEGLKAFMENPILLYHHKFDTALGKVLEAKVDDSGLYVKALVDSPEPGTIVADYVRKIKNGVIRGFSVGGKFFRKMTDAGPRIFKCDLREISCTPLPVNSRTLFAVAGKAFTEDQPMPSLDTAEIEVALERLGNTFAKLEGKAGHPDGPAIAALQYHLVKIHTLATNTKQDAGDPKTEEIADSIAKTAEKHSADLHKHAANIGAMATHDYGASYL